MRKAPAELRAAGLATIDAGAPRVRELPRFLVRAIKRAVERVRHEQRVSRRKHLRIVVSNPAPRCERPRKVACS